MAGDGHILVIDVERHMADAICQMVRRERYEATPVLSGPEGVALLSERSFDLVITEMSMATVGGLDVLRHVREHCPDTLVILMAQRASAENLSEAIQLGAFDHLPKPIDHQRLVKSVHRAFERIGTERMRVDMISTLSHDLKVPLTSIIGYTSLVWNRREEQWHPRARDFINIIASSANKILAMLDNYLTTCKLEAGRLRLQRGPLHLNQLMVDLESVLAPEAEKRGIEIEFSLADDPLPLELDENLIFRALCNIANNAVKYSPPNTSVRILTRMFDARSSPLGLDTVTCVVENPGPGIPPHEIPHIFDRYQRTRGSRKIEGSGIGLFVVKMIVEAHGGMVEVESEPDKATRFKVHLPMALAAAAV